MNKFLFILIIIFCIFISGNEIAVVYNVKGESTLRRYENDGHLTWGKIILSEDIIKTNSRSFVDIKYIDNRTYMKIMDETEILLKGDLKRDILEKTIVLKKGVIYLNLIESSVFIETEHGIVFADNAEFFISNDDNEVLATCIKGNVIIENASGRVSLDENESGLCVKNESPFKAFTPLRYESIGMDYDILEIEFVDEYGNIRILEIIID